MLRVISVMLVMYGHFVLVGGGAKVIPNVINPDFAAFPLISETQWRAYYFEIFLIETFSTQSAALGVSLFFLITGYLMPLMCERYSRREFLLNRFFRIFPTLAASLIVLGIFLYFVQGITFGATQYLASLTLTYHWLGIVPVTGVLWTLVIEVLFYFVAFLVGFFSLPRLVFVQVILLVLVLLGTIYHDNYYVWFAGYQSRFLLFITIGSAIYLAEKKSGIFKKLLTVLPSVVFSYLGFQVFKFGKVDASTYENLGAHLLELMIFLLFYYTAPFVMRRLPKVVEVLADLVYPLYLVHVAIGLATMAFVREYVLSPYLLLLSAVITSLIVSWILHRFIEKPVISFGRRFTNSKSKA